LDLPLSGGLLKSNDSKLFPILKMGLYNNPGEKVPVVRPSSAVVVALCCSLITPRPDIVIGMKCYSCMHWVCTKVKLGMSATIPLLCSYGRTWQFVKTARVY